MILFLKKYVALPSLLLLLCCFSLQTITAQSFKANIENLNGYYRLTFTVTSSDVSHFTPPSLNGYEVLSGPSTSTMSNYQLINGHASHNESTTFTYIIAPRKSGKQTIGAASVRVGNRVLRSNALVFNASAQQGGGHQGNSNAHNGGNDMNNSVQQAGSPITQHDLFIDVTPSRTKVREQEAVLLTYRIHARVGVGLSNTSLTQKPDFKGLISQEIPLPGNQIQTTIEHRGGAAYRTGTILQYLVFPQQSGQITIPSITFDCAVVQQDNTMDLADAFFNGGGTIGVQVRRKVAPITLQVEALPKPRPANFSGAVGKFNIKGELLNHDVKTNDVATYQITLAGLGNMKLITPPSIKFPSDFDTYDPKTSDNTKVTASGLNGQLTFNYTFVPRNVGSYTIPAADFVYFDTESGTYKTLHTEPITLNVAKGKKSNADVDKQLALLKSDIRQLHTNNGDMKLEWGSWAYRLATALLFFIMCFALFGVKRWMESNNDVIGRRKRKANKTSMLRLQKAAQIIYGKANGNFYSTISQALYGYVSDTFNIESADLNSDNIEHVLSQKGIDKDHISALFNVLETCQLAQYGSDKLNSSEAVFNQAKDVIESIEDDLKHKK